MSGPSILLWGCGRWGVNVLRDLVALGADVTVLARDAATVERALGCGARRVVGAVEDVAATDGVVVVTPASHHGEAIRASARFECPIFSEKPLTHDVDEAQQLVDAFADRLFVMHKWRWHPGIEGIASIADSRELGPPVGLTCTRLGMDMRQEDVDALDTLAPHDLSIGLAILGRLPSRVVAAVGEPWPGRSRSWMGCHALLRDDSGPWLALHCSGTTASRLRRVELVCEAGSVVLASPSALSLDIIRSHRSSAGTVTEQIPLEALQPLFAELADFLGYLAGGPPPRSPASEGLAVVQALAAVRTALDVASV